jgi:hypothetical protein
VSYRVEYLKKNHWDSNGKRIKLTDSAIYLLPMVGLSIFDFDDNLINVHVKHADSPSLVVIVKNKTNDDNLSIIINKLMAYREYVDMWTDDDDREICIEMKVPQRLVKNYHKFIDGKYSKFDERYKDKLIAIYNREVIVDNRKLTVYSVLYPQEFKRKQIAEWLGVDWKMIGEVKDIPTLNYEIYRTIDQLKLLDKNNDLVEFKQN